MITCICHNINSNNIRNIIKNNNIHKVKDLHKLGLCNCCKKCSREIRKIINEQDFYKSHKF